MLENKHLTIPVQDSRLGHIGLDNPHINAMTGDSQILYNRIRASIAKATTIDIIVSFLMESGVKMLVKDLKDAIDRGVSVRILTGNYLNITQPQALYLLRGELGDKVDLRFYNVPNKSFHPKAYIFHYQIDGEIYTGSSNLSRGALTTSIEWNYRIKSKEHEADFNYFYATFSELFYNHAVKITDEVLRAYSKQWTKPPILRRAIEEEELQEKFAQLYEPRGAQIEALYALNQTRKEGLDKALVVAATGIGKTYLAAFDSKQHTRVLFIAHREEIIKQAAISFNNVRPDASQGFFYGHQKEVDKDLTFALVQTLGRKEYLNEEYFKKGAFDYIIIDEFHHAAAGNYKNIMSYFTPKFLLGLTATPERLDSKDVFALCDYNRVYEVRLREAIEKDWLVPFRYYGIYDDTVDYGKLHIVKGKYEEKELEQALMLHQRAELVLKHYNKYNAKCAMGFCVSKAHAEQMAKYFTSQGIPSAAVYSGEQGEMAMDRNVALNQLKQRELQVIFSIDMFNEGLDVPSIDTVLFLRPTESPTVFLQQLGRGLRKFKGKEYLTVLDFIGNYKKSMLVPFLLSGRNYEGKALIKGTPMQFDFPEGCYVDFDFRLIDLFKKQAEEDMLQRNNLDELIKESYFAIKEELGYRPSRVDMFLHMEEVIINAMKKKPVLNIFRDYLTFLADNNELTEEEEQLYHSRAKEFMNMVETTGMVKSYKMPVFNAFFNNGDINIKVTDEAIYNSFKAFYDRGSNGVDMVKDKGTADYKNWNQNQYVSLAKRNPIHFLIQSASDFFREEEGYALVMNEELRPFIQLESFKAHFKDCIDLRVLNYYKDRFDKKGDNQDDQ